MIRHLVFVVCFSAILGSLILLKRTKDSQVRIIDGGILLIASVSVAVPIFEGIIHFEPIGIATDAVIAAIFVLRAKAII
jgi:hypothetical protein